MVVFTHTHTHTHTHTQTRVPRNRKPIENKNISYHEDGT